MAVMEVAVAVATTEVDVTGASALLAAALVLRHEAVATTTIAREAHETATMTVDLAVMTGTTDAASAHVAQRQTVIEPTVTET